MGIHLPAVDLGSGRHAVELALGIEHSCARLDNGQVKCWGDNDVGQLGLGDANPRGDQQGEMGDNLPAVNLGVGRTATALALGGTFTCALLDNGVSKCWGFHPPFFNPANLNIGDQPGEMGDELPALDFGSGRSVVQLAAGAAFACARLDNGTVKCWGGGIQQYGQLGLGNTRPAGLLPQDMGSNLVAVNLGTGRTAIDLVVSFNHVCVRLDNGATKCWGDNTFGALGMGDVNHRGNESNEMGDSLPALEFGTGLTAESVSLGALGGCAILSDHTLKCWGYYGMAGAGQGTNLNSFGDQPNEMGNNLPVVSLGTDLLENVGSLMTATQVVNAGSAVCALLNIGAVKCWGGQVDGELGRETDVPSVGVAPGEMGDALPFVSLPP